MQTSKVILYFLANLFSLSRTEFGSQPFVGITITFAVIAAIRTMTQRYNIRRHSTRTVGRRKWYPVISGNGMPQALWSATCSTTATEIIKTSLPIQSSQSVRQTATMRGALRGLYFIPCRVFVSSSSLVLAALLSVFFVRPANRSSTFVRVFGVIPFFYYLSFIGIAFLPSLTPIKYFARVGSIRYAKFFQNSLFINVVSLIRSLASARAALGIQPINFLFIFTKIREKFQFTAFCAALIEDCIHGVPFTLCPTEVAARAVGLSAFSLIRLGRTPSIPQILAITLRGVN